MSRKEGLWAGGLFALATLVILPVFWRGLPCSDDTLPHFFRTVQLDVNLRQGAPFLQWGPDLLRGYGYPIFAFYAPLTYWLLEAIHLLGTDFGPALQIAFAGSLWLAGWGAYVLARRTLAPAGAFVAGLAYLFAPYVLYDAIPRGALPELLALALLPWALAAADRAQTERGRATVVAALLLALLILTHNVVSILGLALALALAVAGLPRPAGRRPVATLWHGLSPAVAAIVLALGLTAFFWLPGVAELRYTQSSRPDPPIAVWPRFEQHLVPPASLLAWPEEPADPALLNPPIVRALGVGQAAFALLSLPALLAYRGAAARRRQLVAWVTVALASLFFASTLSVWWWNHLDPLRFIQLPTRFLGPASLAVALLAGLGAQWLAGWGRGAASRSLFLALPALAVALSGWPWLYPRTCPVPDTPTLATLAEATTWDRWLAEAQAELLPRWVDELPPEDGLIAAYQAGQPVNRLALPESASLLHWESGPGRDRYELRLAQAETLLYQSFYFPGWQARLDDRAHPVAITSPHGLISVDVPAGEHTLAFSFERTPLRLVTLAISGLFALAIVAYAAVFLARQPAHSAPEPPAGSGPPIPSRALLLMVVLLLLLKAGIVDRLDSPIRASRFDGSRLQGLAAPADVSFGGELRFLGASAPAEVVSGGRFSLTGYWSALRPLGVPYGFSVRVAGDDGSVWNRPPERPFGYAGYPVTFTWEPGQYARDAYEITLLPGAPPGDYWIEVAAFRRDIDLSLTPLGAPSGPDPAQARVGRIRVLPAANRVDAATLDAQRAAVDVYSPVALDAARLLGWSLPEISIRSGEQIPVTLLWLAPPAPANPDDSFTLALTGDDSTVVAEATFPYGPPGYPPEQWAPETLVRQIFRWRIPAEVRSGAYRLLLDGVTLGTVEVDAPERSFAPPVVATGSDAAMGIARLAGFTVAPEAAAPGETVTVALSWQVTAGTETSYRVFVHLRDGSGAVRAQSDGVPAEWTRPTTGWLPGEYVLDRHAITLPADLGAGTYDLVAGLYDPATGERLGEAPLTAVDVR